jgi:helicase associated protein
MVGDKSRGRSVRALRSLVWENRLEELLAFRRAHGHLNVPRRWAVNPKLANWVTNQRRLILRGTLDGERLLRLKRCGVRWVSRADQVRAREAAWEGMLAALRAFRQSHGHLRVPRTWPDHPSLPRWVATQRFLRKAGTLAERRFRKLNELGFEWKPPTPPRKGSPSGSWTQNQAWEHMFTALQRYKRSHGHCDVPARWVPHRQLGLWVSNQRSRRRRGLLPPDREARLNSLGFVWKPSRARRH